ncbi:hypothetical protein HJB53_30205 [Rhizobium lentis]|uniref:hypothetical protein n=1 Tax=Rhizobium lentis TaxID=1138194 RepID=UPI001C839D45|nr:hypothetical protein [Rhizobium lentis]MBX5130765.1 hypothetical protein [Rhizobium lentis]
MTVKIRFHNRDAKPKRIEFDVSKAAVAPVMAWYGAFHAGDAYTVSVEKDLNGELVGELA